MSGSLDNQPVWGQAGRSTGETNIDKQGGEKMAEFITADFQNMLANNDLPGASKWLDNATQAKKYEGNTKWREDRERELLRAACDQGDQALAEKIIAGTNDYFSQNGRIKKYEYYFGPYDGRRVELTTAAEKTARPIKDSGSFKQALYSGRTEEAAAWLKKISAQGYYKTLTGEVFARWLTDRQNELEILNKQAT